VLGRPSDKSLFLFRITPTTVDFHAVLEKTSVDAQTGLTIDI